MYDDLKNALLSAQTIPMAEYAWDTRPTGQHGIFQPDFEIDDNGDNYHQDRGWQGSVDLYTNGTDNAVFAEIEGILDEFCEGGWYINLNTVDTETRLLHREYVFELEAM